jgi:prepilin-type N-terminal cleavage/methylation domain-containing protein
MIQREKGEAMKTSRGFTVLELVVVVVVIVILLAVVYLSGRS